MGHDPPVPAARMQIQEGDLLLMRGLIEMAEHGDPRPGGPSCMLRAA